MKPTLCRLHRLGVPVGTRPFYVENCPTCLTKLAKGLVRGDEGPPPTVAEVVHSKRPIDWPKARRAREALRLARLEPYRIGTKGKAAW